MENIELKSITITLIVSFSLGLISIELLGEYGLVVFAMLPLLIGFLPPFIVGQRQDIALGRAYKLSFITLGLACLGLLVFAMEGLICIVMASPLLALFTYIGSHFGFWIHDKEKINSSNVSIILILLTAGLMSFDYVNEPKGLIPVRTTITIDANIHQVWNNVVTFNKIDEPVDWIFKTGIAYPTDATISGTGVGAIRYCNFTTGSFVEPITTWEAPHLLQFDVKEQPIPMNELNPFWDVHPPHLEGYFKSFKGQFKLKEIGQNKTELEGTTWYQVDIHPEFYWKSWSNFIIHRIHNRVLRHIKKESETL